jgi:hypothetical protein
VQVAQNIQTKVLQGESNTLTDQTCEQGLMVWREELRAGRVRQDAESRDSKTAGTCRTGMMLAAAGLMDCQLLYLM